MRLAPNGEIWLDLPFRRRSSKLEWFNRHNDDEALTLQDLGDELGPDDEPTVPDFRLPAGLQDDLRESEMTNLIDTLKHLVDYAEHDSRESAEARAERTQMHRRLEALQHRLDELEQLLVGFIRSTAGKVLN